MAQWVTDYIRVLEPVNVPKLSVVVQVNLVVWSILRAMLCVSPQFNFAFTVAMFIETCLVDILVVAIGVCTTIVCTLAYYSLAIFLWCMRGIINRVGLRQVFVPVRQCRFCQCLSIMCVLLMIPDSLLYTYWHFNFVRQTWLHNFFVVIQVLHILPTALMIFATIAQGKQKSAFMMLCYLSYTRNTAGFVKYEIVTAVSSLLAGMFLVGVIISTNPLRVIALAHRNKVRKHVYAFAGLNISLLLYSASAIFIAYRRGFKINMIVFLVWFIEIMFRVMSVVVAGYIEMNIGDENLLPPNRALGGAEQAGGGVDDGEQGDTVNEVSDESPIAEPESQNQREHGILPLSQTPRAVEQSQEVDQSDTANEASDESPIIELESHHQRECGVLLVSQAPTLVQRKPLQLAFNLQPEQSSEPFIPVPNSEYMELPIPTSRPTNIPFLSPYGAEFSIPGSLVAQESDQDSVPSSLVTINHSFPFSQ